VSDAAPASRNIGLALKDATLAGLVAFGLFVFMIGLRTEQGGSGALEISTRFPTLAILVAVVFAGAFLRALIFARGPVPLGLVGVGGQVGRDAGVDGVEHPADDAALPRV
jgi:hypothetical protein